jgi:hypothetical protein
MPKAKGSAKPRKPAPDPRLALGPNVDLTPVKAHIGRPTTFHPSYCNKVIQLGALGYSSYQISAEINVPRLTMMTWANQDNENGRFFSAALSRARELERAWWERRGQLGLEDRHFNAHLWVRTMACRWRQDYSDRVEVTGADGGPILFQTVYEEPPKTIDVTPEKA